MQGVKGPGLLRTGLLPRPKVIALYSINAQLVPHKDSLPLWVWHCKPQSVCACPCVDIMLLARCADELVTAVDYVFIALIPSRMLIHPMMVTVKLHCLCVALLILNCWLNSTPSGTGGRGLLNRWEGLTEQVVGAC